LIQKVKDLPAGAKVRITWEHIYVTQEGSKFPERPLRSLDVI
ncbi:MAG: hypothetical protein EZS28_026617, partial [Streblomastix strix]